MYTYLWFHRKALAHGNAGFVDTGLINSLGPVYLPIMFQSEPSTASTLCVGAVFADVKRGLSDDSFETLTLKSDTINSLNHSLSVPSNGPVSDLIIYTIGHMMAIEASTGDDEVLGAHCRAMDFAVQSRGGLDKLGHEGQTAHAAAK